MDRDNYFSCGECFELVRTKPDGTDYVIGDALYTDPIILEVTDSCPCYVNSKWCCKLMTTSFNALSIFSPSYRSA